MARRERVGSASIVSDASRLSTPWAGPVNSAAAEAVPEQYTEVAAYARSPSPAPDGFDEAAADALSQTGRHLRTDANSEKPHRVAGNTHLQQDVLDSSVHETQEVQNVRKQSGDTRDSLSQQCHIHPQQQERLRPGTAEVIMSGEITGAVGFGDQALYCTWQLVYDMQLWELTQGLIQGRTHASSPLLPEDGTLSGVVWELPLKFALVTSTMQQWPRIVFKLFRRDVWLGRDVFVGYSLCNLPNTPGCHHISCPVWSAVEARRSFRHKFICWFTGLTPQLVDETFITDLEQRYEQGQHLHTRDCSSSISWPFNHPHAPTSTASALAVGSCSRLGSAGGSYCRSFSAAGAGGAAAAGPAGLAGSGGGRVCLRLHVVARGLSQLKVIGGDSVGRTLEKLRDTVGLMRRQQEHKHLYDEEEEESEGLRIVREGRVARLAAAREHMDGVRDRDQQYTGDSSSGTYAGSPSRRASNLPGRSSPSRNSRLHSGAFNSSGSNGTGSMQTEITRDLGGIESPPRFSRAGRLGASSLASSTSPSRQQVPSGRFLSTSARVSSGSPGPAGLGSLAADPGLAGRNLGVHAADSNQQERVPLRHRGSVGGASELSARLPPPRFEQQSDE